MELVHLIDYSITSSNILLDVNVTGLEDHSRYGLMVRCTAAVGSLCESSLILSVMPERGANLFIWNIFLHRTTQSNSQVTKQNKTNKKEHPE